MRLAVSTRTSQGLFSAYETRRMIGRPIAKSIPAIASPTMGLEGVEIYPGWAFSTPLRYAAVRLSDD